MKNSYSLLFIIFLCFTLASCGSEAQTEVATEKQVFTIQTKKLQDFWSDFTSEKTATIQANSNLTLTAETAGVINSISAKEWSFLNAGTKIVSLKDNLNNYDLTLQQAQNGVIVQQTSADTSLVNLDVSIANAQSAYDKALQAYKNLIDTNNLQYDNVVQKNKDTLKTYNDAYKNYLSNVDALMTQYLHEGDVILGMTSQYEWRNEAWEAYLGAHAGDSKKEAQDRWNDVYAARGLVRQRIEKNLDFTNSNTDEDIKIISNAFENTRVFADKMIFMLQNNAIGAGLGQEMSNGWLSAWTNYRSAIGNQETGFINWKTQTNTFLSNYKKNEEATKLAVESLDRALSAQEFNEIQADGELNLAYQNASLTLKNNIANAKISLDQAKTSLENAKKIKSATEKQLQAGIANAKISLAQAQRNAGKLSVNAPVKWVVTKILVEVGQTVSLGTSIAEFSGQGAQAVIDIDPRMALLLKVGDEISAKVNNENITGNITAISAVAGKNLLSTVRIAFDNAEQFIGQAAVISFNIPESASSSFLLPINAVKIISEGEGEIQTYMDGKIVSQKVRLGAMYGASIEIFSDMNADTPVITNDVSTFNSSIYDLKVE